MNNQAEFREKKHRLSLQCYEGRVRASFTLCIDQKKIFFIEKKVVDSFLEILLEVKNKDNCKNWICTFMPEHVHLILDGNSDKTNLWKTVVSFKQKTGFWLSKNKPEIQWQKSFYDHVFREDDDLRKHIRYILNNPVRRGLVDNWKDYKFSGSLDFDLEEIVR